MAAKKFLKLVAGVITEAFGVQTSAGVANAGDVVSLNDSGEVDITMMPSGIGAQTKVILASEAIAAGNWVNVYNTAGTANVRKADATTAGKECNGFVKSAISSGATGTVYLSGTNNQVTGQAVGKIFLGTTAGSGTATAPSSSGNVVQELGYAVSATEVAFNPKAPITLA
jgi:hypothetical protein